MTINFWQTFPLFLAFLVPSLASPNTSFENTAIVRTVELGGSVVHITTTFAIKAIEAGSKVYTIALGPEEKHKTSWLDAKVKGQQASLPVSEHDFDVNKYVYASSRNNILSYSLVSSDYHLLDVALPKALGVNSTMNIVLETVQTHATTPWPERASQKDDQALKYETNLFVLSPYHTSVQRTKLK